MPNSGSVTEWLGRLKTGEEEAAEQLWARYFADLVRIARSKFRWGRHRVADEEDAALSALDSFCRAAAAGRFPKLTDRHGLWPLLVAITARKAIRIEQHERRKKRGGGLVRGDSAFAGPAGDGDADSGWQQVLGREPSPAFACEVAEECQRLLKKLPTESMRSVAVWKMEGYTNAEIAAKLGCVDGTVERKLRDIRKIWSGKRA
jgi:DNA-directed RNA polymerase specialized sigma24 family protein